MPNHHAHDAMQMMLDSGDTYTRESFTKAIADRFGPDARFCSCSNADMAADDLLAFLFGRGKLTGDIDGSFRMGAVGHCGHEH